MSTLLCNTIQSWCSTETDWNLMNIEQCSLLFCIAEPECWWLLRTWTDSNLVPTWFAVGSIWIKILTQSLLGLGYGYWKSETSPIVYVYPPALILIDKLINVHLVALWGFKVWVWVKKIWNGPYPASAVVPIGKFVNVDLLAVWCFNFFLNKINMC